MSLDDLHASDKKGKWWLVGSAWSGDPLVDAKHNQKEHHITSTTASSETEGALLKLARKQGMNTDVRRSIFVVLMSSDVCTSSASFSSVLCNILIRRIMSMRARG